MLLYFYRYIKHIEKNGGNIIVYKTTYFASLVLSIILSFFEAKTQNLSYGFWLFFITFGMAFYSEIVYQKHEKIVNTIEFGWW